jgi:putative phosphoribosyl transferase
MPRFKDRTDAGRQLAGMLTHLRGKDVIVLGLPRGGLIVAYEVAHALEAPLDLLNVRKLGVPWQEELAMGAIATGGVQVFNNDIIMSAGVNTEELEEAVALQQLELQRREHLYRGGGPAPDLRGRTVVLVDDGIATGSTVRAAIAVIRAQHPARLVLAVPVAQESIAATLAGEVDELICVRKPGDLYAISAWYDHFPQTTDREIQAVLSRAAAEPATALLHTGRAGNGAADGPPG